MGITLPSLSNKTLEAVIPACKKGKETYICNNVNATVLGHGALKFV